MSANDNRKGNLVDSEIGKKKTDSARITSLWCTNGSFTGLC